MNHLPELRKKSAETLLGLYKKANAGHIGSSLSCLEILLYLTCDRMKSEDQVVLSKGHAACALYVALAQSGRIPLDALSSFYQNGTLLAAHPPCSGKIESIPFGTGSLGHGLSLATGLVFSQKYTNKNFKVFTVLSDGDCNEGSTWEAALFAGHHRLENLFVIVDANSIQGIGNTKEILDMEPMDRKWREFGFDTQIVENGNDFVQLHQAFEKVTSLASKKPKALIARTTKGHGVSFMQNTVDWHYLPMSDEQFEIALEETQGHA